MGLDHVLVPMDGSPLSKQALRIALEEYPDTAVTVLHVIDPSEPGYSYPAEFDPDVEPLHGSEEWYERAEELEDELLSEAEGTAEDYDAELTLETAVGTPGREIVDLASESDIDQIIIGSHGRSDEEEPLLGSVTETVVFRSPVRVLLVR
ncbi:universal stress protein [Natronomonas sp. LN261]|uniref:universal stress protein n=1 Tax=Natronomonas sp. LN261 TaxID=2750669 RepID=UPI0015EE98C3|nr:universal stress protein [Natronomonas sp. LN261]